MEEYNALKYPDGVERVAEEMLDFLPDDREFRIAYMDVLLEWLIEW